MQVFFRPINLVVYLFIQLNQRQDKGTRSPVQCYLQRISKLISIGIKHLLTFRSVERNNGALNFTASSHFHTGKSFILCRQFYYSFLAHLLCVAPRKHINKCEGLTARAHANCHISTWLCFR